VPPSSSPQLVYNEGKILSNPKVANIFYGDFYKTAAGQKDVAHTDAFAKDLVHNKAYTSIWAQYGVHEGTYRGSSVITPKGTAPTVVGESGIRDIVKKELAEGKIKNDGQTIYTVYLPPGTILKAADGTSSQDGLGGYHGSFMGADGKPVYYAAIVYGQGKNGIDFDGNPEDNQSIVASHEWSEAATDPDVDKVIAGAPEYKNLGWYDLQYGEIGDIAIDTSKDANLRDVWGKMDGFAYQKLWSNVDGRTELGAKHPGPVVKPTNE
jgi:hypothetical protein